MRINSGEEYKDNIFTTGSKLEGVLYNLAVEQGKKVEELEKNILFVTISFHV